MFQAVARDTVADTLAQLAAAGDAAGGQAAVAVGGRGSETPVSPAGASTAGGDDDDDDSVGGALSVGVEAADPTAVRRRLEQEAKLIKDLTLEEMVHTMLADVKLSMSTAQLQKQKVRVLQNMLWGVRRRLCHGRWEGG
jgi:hypothetical protein